MPYSAVKVAGWYWGSCFALLGVFGPTGVPYFPCTFLRAKP
jgi:hypothetical protein